MISKVITGATFRGCCKYVMNKAGAEVLFSRGVREDNVLHTISDFETIRNLRPGLKKAVLHTSISFAYEDVKNLNNNKRTEIAIAFLKKLNLENNQTICVKHTDAKHDHFHIVSNRVGFDGSVASDKFIKNRAARACDELEVEFGLTVARGHGIASEVKHKSPEKNRLKQLIKSAVENGLRESPKDFQGLINYLAVRGIEMKIQYQSTGRVNGISFRTEKIAFKGSAIDKNFSYKRLATEISKSRDVNHIENKLQQTKQSEYER